jgi:transcriptional regulator with PAS, ATPase and Fis domain
VQVLLNYRFPGNIRQLKDLVEQISVLELERDISADTLRRYLPQEGSLVPAVVPRQQKGEDAFTERDLLYKVLFEMRRDLTDLKKLVHDVLQHESYGSQMLHEHRNLFDGMDGLQEDDSFDEASEAVSLRIDRPGGRPSEQPSSYDLARVEDIVHEMEEDESLSLEKKEKEMIVKALRKNNNKRKWAAQDLGISERTLYRKIKQYEIEE